MTILFAFAAAAALHLPANNCELFVDKAVTIYQSHGYTEVDLFLKVLPERLDGAVKQAGFRQLATDATTVCADANGQSPVCGGVDQWVDTAFTPFFSNDYFRGKLFVSGDYMPIITHTGAFYVITDKGTTYWAHAADGRDFVIDYAASYKVAQALGGGSYGSFDLSRVVKTADTGLPLNPSGCR